MCPVVGQAGRQAGRQAGWRRGRQAGGQAGGHVNGCLDDLSWRERRREGERWGVGREGVERKIVDRCI